MEAVTVFLLPNFSSILTQGMSNLNYDCVYFYNSPLSRPLIPNVSLL